MNSPTQLAEKRKQASDLTMGVSSSWIYDAVLKELKLRQATGSCLDYGAGAGALLKLLHASRLFEQLYGADLMARPADLEPSIHWIQQDLNDDLESNRSQFDVLVSSEVIEHLENPRAVFRDFHSKLKPGGLLVVTTPNQQSIRSFVSLITMGHFDQFRDRDYPRHITALLHKDLERCASEAGFHEGQFSYTGNGLLPLPKLTTTWQQIFTNKLSGRLFSDNVIFSCIKSPERGPAEPSGT